MNSKMKNLGNEQQCVGWLLVTTSDFQSRYCPGLLLSSSAKESRIGSPHYIGEPFTLLMDLSHLGKV